MMRVKAPRRFGDYEMLQQMTLMFHGHRRVPGLVKVLLMYTSSGYAINLELVTHCPGPHVCSVGRIIDQRA